MEFATISSRKNPPEQAVQPAEGQPSSYYRMSTCPEDSSPPKHLPRQRSGNIRRVRSSSRGDPRQAATLVASARGLGDSPNPAAGNNNKGRTPTDEAGLCQSGSILRFAVTAAVQSEQLSTSFLQKCSLSENVSTAMHTKSPKQAGNTDSQADTGLQEMKNYIGQVETLLHQMKEWVAKKEQSGSQKSHGSNVKLCLHRESEQDTGRPSHRSGIPAPMPPNLVKSNASSRSRRSKQDRTDQKRKNIFFGKDLESAWEEAILEDSERAPQKQRARSGSTGLKNTDGVLNAYIKDCFMQKIKHSMLPSQSVSTLKRTSGQNISSPTAQLSKKLANR